MDTPKLELEIPVNENLVSDAQEVVKLRNVPQTLMVEGENPFQYFQYRICRFGNFG